MSRKNKMFAIVGPGRLGTAIALALRQSGETVSVLVTRDPQKRSRALARTLGARISTSLAECDVEVVWFCVPDAAIAAAAQQFASACEWSGKIALHSSGALSSDELAPLRKRGAYVASVHPMMSFALGVRPELKGVTFALEGDAQATAAVKRLIRKWGARAIELRKQDKVLYHAWGAFLSPMLIAELATAETVAEAIGLSGTEARRIMAPIVRQTLENYLAHGAAPAFTGPIVRGDVETVRRHLKALSGLKPASDVYMALLRAALSELPAANKSKLKALVGSGDSASETA